MKTDGLIARYPWLLIWAAFGILILVWMVTIYVSRQAPSNSLTPQEEAQLLLKRRNQP